MKDLDASSGDELRRVRGRTVREARGLSWPCSARQPVRHAPSARWSVDLCGSRARGDRAPRPPSRVPYPSPHDLLRRLDGDRSVLERYVGLRGALLQRAAVSPRVRHLARRATPPGPVSDPPPRPAPLPFSQGLDRQASTAEFPVHAEEEEEGCSRSSSPRERRSHGKASHGHAPRGPRGGGPVGRELRRGRSSTTQETRRSSVSSPSCGRSTGSRA